MVRVKRMHKTNAPIRSGPTSRDANCGSFNQRFQSVFFDVASADITIDDDFVHVETDNYIVQFNKGVIEYIYNKLTDETHTHPNPRGEPGYTGVYWRDKKVLTRTATLVSATQVSANAVELLYRQEGTDILLSIAVDPMTDDLLIDMEGVSDTPGIV